MSNATSPSFSVTAFSELTDIELTNPGFDDIHWSLNKMMISYLAMTSTSTAFGNTSMAEDGDRNIWFTLMAAENNQSTVSAFLDPEVLMRSVRNVYRVVASQVAAQYMLIPTNISVTGEMRYSEKRLHVRLVSFISMEFFLVALIGVTVLIHFHRPYACAPQDPTTIAYSMTIL